MGKVGLLILVSLPAAAIQNTVCRLPLLMRTRCIPGKFTTCDKQL